MRVPLLFAFRTNYYEFSLFTQSHKLDKFKEAKYSKKLSFQRRIQSPVGYLRLRVLLK